MLPVESPEPFGTPAAPPASAPGSGSRLGSHHHHHRHPSHEPRFECEQPPQQQLDLGASCGSAGVAAAVSPPSATSPPRERSVGSYINLAVPSVGAAPRGGAAATAASFQPAHAMTSIESAVSDDAESIAAAAAAAAQGDAALADVGVHVYDLSNGFAARYGGLLFARGSGSGDGDAGGGSSGGGGGIDGIYHSSVVVYGLEFFFEGGVSVAAKGCTRFGRGFAYHFLGQTRVAQREFLAWVRARQPAAFALEHYHLVRHNCHAFTDAAVAFLLGGGAGTAGGSAAAATMLATLRGNTATLAGSPIARLALPVVERFTGGLQRSVAGQLALHEQQLRRTWRERAARAASLAGVPALPPRAAMLFTTSAEAAGHALRQLPRLVDPVEDGFAAAPADARAVDAVAAAVVAGDCDGAALDEFAASRTLLLLQRLLEAKALHFWAPLLDAWRVLALHRVANVLLACDARLNGLLLRGAYCFHAMPADARLALLRVLCNYAAAAPGAAVLMDARRVHQWVGAVGQGLAAATQPAVVEAAAALALNVALALAALTRTTLDRELASLGEAHVVTRLVTMLLFHAQSAEPAVTESARHALLLALWHLCAASDGVALMVLQHEIQLNAHVVAARCQTQETRALLCLLGRLLEICDAENDSGSDDDDGGRR